MKRSISTLTGLTFVIFTLAIVATVPAAEISYQGVLTDAGGDPVPDGGYSVHVSFFDDSVGGTRLWEETHLNVQISSGLFGLVLGSINPIADGWYGAASAFDVWLEVDVDGDGPFSPRTRMTSVPQAMNAQRVTGDILTMPGLLEMHPPDPGAVGVPGFRLQVEPTVSMWKLFPPGAVGPEDTCGGMTGTVSTEIISLNLTSDFEWDDACDSLTGIKLVLDSTKARMFLRRHTNGSYVDITTNISPSIAMMEPLSMTSINLGATPSQGGLFAMSSKSSASNDSNSVELMTSSSGASLNINHNQGGAADEGSMVAVSTGPSSGASIHMFNLLPVAPAGPEDAAILFNTTPGSGANMYMFNPQPEPPAVPWLALGTDVGGGVKGSNIGGNIGLLMFNPQPEPPADPQLEMLSDALGGRFNLWGAVAGRADGNSALQLSAETTEASLTVAHDYQPPVGGTDSNKVSIQADSTQASMSLFGGPSNGTPDIVLTADGTNGGRIGIGTATPTEALYVVGNIIATGNITALTETKVKKNIETVVDALEKVCDLRGVTYDMRRDEYPELKLSDKRQLGFLAEEIQAVVPHVVLDNGDNLRSVDYGRLTPLLVEAIKELRLQNEDLKRRIEQLESR